jgi:hypothetical protein
MKNTENSATTWTVDAQGNYIDWTAPPYYVDGVLNLALPGESVGTMPRAVHIQRTEEYMKLRRRQMKKRPQVGET